MTDLILRSPAFANGDEIPDRYGYDAANVNPPLEIDGVPDETESFVLIMDDPDAMEPAGKIWEHWICWNIPSGTESIPEDWNPTESASLAVEGANDFDEVGYGGPAPPDREHTYRCGLYALDTTLDVAAEASKDEVTHAMHGHVVAHAELTGTYAPR
jgi:Raf kinase inhibitor-like YbhB/YbcL family protein